MGFISLLDGYKIYYENHHFAKIILNVILDKYVLDFRVIFPISLIHPLGRGKGKSRINVT